MSDSTLKLRDVRRIFRLIGEVRQAGSDPTVWRPHLVKRLRKMFAAEIVISSEVYFRTTATPGVMRVVDIGWGTGPDKNVWQIQTEQDNERPETYRLVTGSALPGSLDPSGASGPGITLRPGEKVPVRPLKPVYGGQCFILSQYALPHVGAVDQLGLHRAWGSKPFTPAEHRLVHLFHVELGRVWKHEVIRQAQDPSSDLPARLHQTLHELLQGASEKQIAIKLNLSQHTIHNYVKALHKRFNVSSRGELLAKAGQNNPANFIPKLSMDDLD